MNCFNVLRWQPRCAKPHINFTGGQIFRLDGYQRLDVFMKARITHRRRIRNRQFLPHVAGEILVSVSH